MKVSQRKQWCLIIIALAGLAVRPGLGRADTGPDHQVEQPRPIQLGTSGGSIGDISSAYCCGGTLGWLVQKVVSGVPVQYILSNNHVLARTNKAAIGEPIIQPGLIDVRCAQDPSMAIADLSEFVTINFKRGTTNTVDAAIAQVRTGAVDTGGSILDIGQVSAGTLPASVGLAVKKSGRTTGLTTGRVSAINVTVDVGYNKVCGVGRQVARFKNQIAITPGTFSMGGDSGSLVVEDAATAPRAVGLLFAGSSSYTLANPIGNVLGAFGVTMVGASGAVSASAASGPRQAAIDRASAVKVRHEAALFRIDGVVGTGVSLSAEGTPVVEIYLQEERAKGRGLIPPVLEDIPTRVVVTGPFEAF